MFTQLCRLSLGQKTTCSNNYPPCWSQSKQSWVRGWRLGNTYTLSTVPDLQGKCWILARNSGTAVSSGHVYRLAFASQPLCSGISGLWYLHCIYFTNHVPHSHDGFIWLALRLLSGVNLGPGPANRPLQSQQNFTMQLYKILNDMHSEIYDVEITGWTGLMVGLGSELSSDWLNCLLCDHGWVQPVWNIT